MIYNMKESPLLVEAKEFLETRKCSNNLIHVLDSLDDDKRMIEAILALDLIFTQILKRRSMLQHSTTNEKDCIDDAVSYVDWLYKHYEISWTKLLNIVRQKDKSKQAIQLLFKLLTLEGKYPPCLPAKGKYFFPEDKLERILHTVIISEVDIKNVVKVFDKYTNYIDVVYYIWMTLPSVLNKETGNEHRLVTNATTIVQQLLVPSEEELSTQNPDVILCYSKNKAKFRPSYTELQKSVAATWDVMARWQHSQTTHKQLLEALIEHILPHLPKPVLTLDYLMASLNADGSIALLALHGIFILVKDYHLEYPNIFGKLYQLFEPSILHTKYKSRLFQLADLFMRSTHLPEALVASYAKRMARLCLSAPPQDIVIMSAFIGNLLIRHPGLKVIIQQPEQTQVACDPFLEDEPDPMKTKALESSLWELHSLQQHVLPKVAKAVTFINKPLPIVEWDLTELLEVSYNDVFQKELKKKLHNESVTFEKPTSMSMPRTSYFNDLWSLT